MAKPNKKPRKNFDSEGTLHKPKKDRAHVAQEFQDLNNIDARDESVRGLLPWAKEAVLGL